ncbi:MAG: ABC transporter permease [Vicinamibacterales bacterium]
MRWYRWLLHLCPAALREEYGDEMADTVARQLRGRTGVARLTAWLVAVADVVATAARAHLDLAVEDTRDALRTCRRNRGYAAAVVAVSALGVGAATAAFSLADHVLVRPLPFTAPDRLVKLWQDQSHRGYSRMELSPGNYDDWRRQSRSFAAMAAFSTTSANALTQAGPLRLDVTLATTSLWETLDARAALGRTFVTADETAGGPPPVVLGDGLWRSVFGGRLDVLGETLTLNGTPHVVVGVMPRGFEFPSRTTTLWMPLRFTPADLEDRGNVFLQAIGRLAPGVTLAQADAELDAIADGLATAFPEANDRTGATVIALRDEVTRQTRLMLLALAGASMAVVLIACANLASLLLARGVQRQRELAVRMAMGARPRRIARQVLTESLWLSAGGGLVGVGLAVLAVPRVAALVPTSLPIAAAPTADLRMLAVAAAATLATGLGFGVAPAWRLARGPRSADLRQGGRVFGGASAERMRAAFVVAEVAAAVVLLVTVGLFVRALWQVQEVDPGFDPRGVVSARTTLPLPKYAAVARREQFYREVLDEVRAVPGVSNAAFISFLPMVMRGGIWPVVIPGVTVPEDARHASLRYTTPDYFATMRIPLLGGRTLAPTDSGESTPVAVVSRSFADRYWPGENPIGRQFTMGTSANDRGAIGDRTIVGVVGDVRVRGLERESEPQVYLPSSQVPDDAIVFYAPKDLVVRTAGDAASVLAAVRRAVTRADPEQPISDARLLTDVVARETASRTAQVQALGSFALVAVVLASLGIHGLLAFVVASRTQEIGVRMAFGARPAAVMALVLGRTALLAGIGVAVGLAVAFAVSRSVQALLAGVDPADAPTFAAAAALAFVVALVASVVPARHAMRIDPLAAIRAE